MNPPPAIDVMILTRDTREHIVDAVSSARALGEVYVLDSGSTDGTQDLATQSGATVIEHPFTGYAAQKNWGLDNLPFKGQWVLILDADERVTPRLHDELIRVATSPDPADGYYVNRILIIMGRCIRHGGLYPSWNLRFFKRGSCRYEDRSVHEHMICTGPTAYINHAMLHVRRESMSQYITKHIRYADLESDELVRRALGKHHGASASALFSRMLRYRQWLRRRVWPVVPFRPFWRFVYMYFARLGFLDGRAGWHLAQLMASYEYMINLLYQEKLAAIKEQKRNKESPTPPTT